VSGVSTAVSLRSVAPSVFLPSLLYGIGQGAIAPVIALSALNVGASSGVASLVVGAVGVGQLLADVPAGSLTARVGERRAMLLATALVAAALLVCVLATSVWVLGVAITLTGAAGAVWQLARQAYLTDAVPHEMRARALSTLGGVQRIGTFVGPFLGAGAMALGGTDGAYWVHIVAAVAGAGLLMLLPDVTERSAADVSRSATSLRTVVGEHSRTLRTLGVGAMMVGVVRQARLAVIPLWGESLGLSSSTVALVFGVSSAIDMLLFYPAGKVMDRFGRVWVAVPCMLLMSGGLLMVPLTTGIVSLGVAAAVMGVGNGMGSGLVMVLGSDVSPKQGRAAFLGVWRLCSDVGSGGGPLVLGGVTAVAGLTSGIAVVGVLGLAGAAAMHRWVPRPGRRPPDPAAPVAPADPAGGDVRAPR
jgi:MFS family permease